MSPQLSEDSGPPALVNLGLLAVTLCWETWEQVETSAFPRRLKVALLRQWSEFSPNQDQPGVFVCTYWAPLRLGYAACSAHGCTGIGVPVRRVPSRAGHVISSQHFAGPGAHPELIRWLEKLDAIRLIDCCRPFMLLCHALSTRLPHRWCKPGNSNNRLLQVCDRGRSEVARSHGERNCRGNFEVAEKCHCSKTQ